VKDLEDLLIWHKYLDNRRLRN